MKVEAGVPVEQIAVNVDVEALKEALKNIGEAFRVIFSRLWEEVKTVVEVILENAKMPEERAQKREAHKLDFTRPRIAHQVMCRKPKLIRKIIH